MASPDPRRSAAAKKAAATRRAKAAAKRREELWREWIRFAYSTVLGIGVLIYEVRRPEGPTPVGAAIGLSALGFNVSAWLDRIGGKK